MRRRSTYVPPARDRSRAARQALIVTIALLGFTLAWLVVLNWWPQ